MQCWLFIYSYFFPILLIKLKNQLYYFISQLNSNTPTLMDRQPNIRSCGFSNLVRSTPSSTTLTAERIEATARSDCVPTYQALTTDTRKSSPMRLILRVPAALLNKTYLVPTHVEALYFILVNRNYATPQTAVSYFYLIQI